MKSGKFPWFSKRKVCGKAYRLAIFDKRLSKISKVDLDHGFENINTVVLR
jgi:hypothetical protein